MSHAFRVSSQKWVKDVPHTQKFPLLSHPPPLLDFLFLKLFFTKMKCTSIFKTGLFCAEKHPHYYKFNMLTFSRSIVHFCASFRLDDATTMFRINFLVICSLWIIIVLKIAISRDCNLHKVWTLMIEIVIIKLDQLPIKAFKCKTLFSFFSTYRQSF